MPAGCSPEPSDHRPALSEALLSGVKRSMYTPARLAPTPLQNLPGCLEEPQHQHLGPVTCGAAPVSFVLGPMGAPSLTRTAQEGRPPGRDGELLLRPSCPGHVLAEVTESPRALSVVLFPPTRTILSCSCDFSPGPAAGSVLGSGRSQGGGAGERQRATGQQGSLRDGGITLPLSSPPPSASVLGHQCPSLPLALPTERDHPRFGAEQTLPPPQGWQGGVHTRPQAAAERVLGSSTLKPPISTRDAPSAGCGSSPEEGRGSGSE